MSQKVNDTGSIRIERIWSMPNKNTFEIKPIKSLLQEEVDLSQYWIDPFANRNKLASVTNDLNTDYDTDYHLDALEFLRIFDDESIDGVLYDPPYSPRQVSECYNDVGYNVTWDTTKASFWGNHKREISRMQDFIIQKLNEQKLSIIALAPMTNLARAIQKDDKAFENLEEIVTMGGNFKSFGNCSPVAEYNYWCDPDAAAFVYDFFYRKKKILNMVGLDVTRKIVLTPTLADFIYRINNRVGDFVKKITAFYMDFHWEYEKIIGCVINDPLAVAWFLDRSLCDGIMAFTQVETSGLAIGQTIVDANNFLRKYPNSYVLTSVDSEKFMKTFIGRITDDRNETEKNWSALKGVF